MSRDKRRDLGAAVGAAVRVYQRAVDAFDDAAAAHLGVNRTDLRCLDVLLERDGVTPGYLARALGLTTGSVTTMLDRLEKRDYVRRTPDPSDRRRVAVHATPAARAAAGRLWGPLAAEGGRVMARYGAAELTLLADVLRRTTQLQEAHTKRIRALARPPRASRARGR